MNEIAVARCRLRALASEARRVDPRVAWEDLRTTVHVTDLTEVLDYIERLEERVQKNAER